MIENKVDLTVDAFDEDLTPAVETILSKAAEDVRSYLRAMGETEATVTLVDFAGPAVRHF